MKSKASSPTSKTHPRRRRTSPVAELDFNDDSVPPRTGDPTSAESLRTLMPLRRARQAGLTSAAVDEDVTADDLSPETLIDEDGAGSNLRGRTKPTDTVLRRISEEEVFTPPSDDPPDADPDTDDESRAA